MKIFYRLLDPRSEETTRHEPTDPTGPDGSNGWRTGSNQTAWQEYRAPPVAGLVDSGLRRTSQPSQENDCCYGRRRGTRPPLMQATDSMSPRHTMGGGRRRKSTGHTALASRRARRLSRHHGMLETNTALDRSRPKRLLRRGQVRGHMSETSPRAKAGNLPAGCRDQGQTSLHYRGRPQRHPCRDQGRPLQSQIHHRRRGRVRRP